jgi:hypothetical protein
MHKKPRGRSGRPVALVVVRFPWGSSLALRCGSSAAPLDVASGGHPPACATVVLVAGCPHSIPGRSRGQEGGAIDEAVSLISFGQSTRGAPLDRRLFSVEDADPSRTFSVLGEPSPNAAVPLTLSWSPAGTPESVSVPPDALSVTRSLRMVPRELTCEPKDPAIARPVRVERAEIRERLPSYRDPASLHLQDGCAPNLVSALRNRAPFRHLSTRALRQAVLRASSRLASSRSTRPCDLPVRTTRDASNRLLPPEQVTCTRSPYVPGSLGPLSRSGTPRDDPWSSRGMTEGPGVFTTPETASISSPPNA